MARRYQIDELLWLRSSPLATKPPGLPPIEEWMGPIPESTPQRKTTTNPRDPNNPTEPTGRRSSIFEARHISRGSNSEDIILGPPKTAFASASRIAGKNSIDSIERPLRQPDTDEPKNDRFNFRDRFFREKESGERDPERRDAKPTTLNGRRSDREDWNAGRRPRTFAQDEPERKPRRNGEFDRWESREGTFERGVRDKDGRFPPRKDGQPGRARHEGSWFRDDNQNTTTNNNNNDALDADEEKSSIRNREWRRDRHGADRDWTRGAKFEQDPEWMDSTEKDEPRRVHTQEDFERWKERMKAGSSQAPVEEKKQASIEPAPSASQKIEHRPTDGEIFSSGGAMFQGDAAMERFFGLLHESKSAAPAPPPPQEVSTPSPVESTKKEVPAMIPGMTGKSAKSSRFAGLFSPPPVSPAKEADHQLGNFGNKPSPVSTPANHDADQEGFQRILQMLGGNKSRNATPHNDNVQLHRPTSLAQAEQIPSAISSPSREQLRRPEQMMMPDTPGRNAGPPMAHEHQAQERDHLLRLMQQVRVSPGPNQALGGHGQPPNGGPGPGMPNMSELLAHPPGLGPPQKTPNFIEDPAIANMPRPDIEQLRRRAGNGPPPAFFDEIPFPQGGQVPITPGGSRPPQGQGLPGMGMQQRPQGFEHMPPPGWGGPQMPPQQGAGGPGPMPAPPGIPNPNRGVNPNFMSGMMPMHGNVPPQPPLGDRQPFPRGAGAGGPPGFPPHPGMMPLPGYVNGPPPPGYPMHMPPGEMMGMGPGGQGPFDGSPGPQGPPPSSRHLLDMFGPGQFR